MSNSIIRLAQSLLIGFVLSSVGYSIKTVVFWLCVVIVSLQWLKEQKNEMSMRR